MPDSKKLVLFDLDGTVVSSFEDIQMALNHGLARHGLPTHDIEAVKSFVGNGIVKLVERALPASAADRLEDVLRDVRRYYDEHPADFADFFPGVLSLVQTLKADGHELALLSNKPDGLVQQMADRMGFRGYFRWIHGERPGVPLKPDPAEILRILAESRAERGVLVGDGIPDGQVARAAGIAFIGVSWGVAPESELAAYGPVAHSAEEVRVLIDSVFAD